MPQEICSLKIEKNEEIYYEESVSDGCRLLSSSITSGLVVAMLPSFSTCFKKKLLLLLMVIHELFGDTKITI